MGKVYLFNPQPSDSSSSPLSAYVNEATPAYTLPFARKQFDYIPSSTSGNRTNVPSGNDFALQNRFLVQGVPPAREYQLNLPDPPPVTADLILYIFAQSLLLFGTDGVFLQSYSPRNAVHEEASPIESIERPELTSSDEKGTVYVFNLFNEPMSPFSPNGQSAGDIGAWSRGNSGDPPIYTPNVLKVGRVLNSSESSAHIFNGTNDIFLAWLSRTGSFLLPIDGGVFPITQNLFLFVLRDTWFLSDTYGVQRLNGRIN